MSITGIRITGPSIAGMGEEMRASLRRRAEAAVLGGALLLETAVKEMLSRPGSGRLYRKRSVVHQASAPGEPPAVDTGKYRNSVTHSRPEWDGDTVSASVGTNDVRAQILEFGGRTGKGRRIRIHPRPHFRPALAQAEPAIQRRLENL